MTYAEASAVAPAGDGTWKAEVQPDWDIFGVANGGYLMAIAARAMSEAAGGRLPVSLTAHFTRPISAGAVTGVGRPGEGGTHVLHDEGHSDRVIGLRRPPGQLRRARLPECRRARTWPERHRKCPAPEECLRALPSADGPLPPPLMAQFEERIHPEDAGPLQGRPSGNARMRGWFRLHDEEPLDVFTLFLTADSFPPAVFNADLPLAWTPTLEMTTQIRGIPAQGWLRCQFTTRFVTRRPAGGRRRDLGRGAGTSSPFPVS